MSRNLKLLSELQKLDEKLTSLAISTSLSLINKNSREKLDELNNNIKKIKEEKIILLQNKGIQSFRKEESIWKVFFNSKGNYKKIIFINAKAM